MNASNDDMELPLIKGDAAILAHLSIDDRLLRRLIEASAAEGLDVPFVGIGKGRRWLPDRKAWTLWYGKADAALSAARKRSRPKKEPPAALPSMPAKLAPKPDKAGKRASEGAAPADRISGW